MLLNRVFSCFLASPLRVYTMVPFSKLTSHSSNTNLSSLKWPAFNIKQQIALGTSFNILYILISTVRLLYFIIF